MQSADFNRKSQSLETIMRFMHEIGGEQFWIQFKNILMMPKKQSETIDKMGNRFFFIPFGKSFQSKGVNIKYTDRCQEDAFLLNKGQQVTQTPFV